MSNVLIVCAVQTNIEFEDVLDDDGDLIELQDNKEYMQKREKFLQSLDKLGTIDVEYEDYY
jgi:hypothetical protein